MRRAFRDGCDGHAGASRTGRDEHAAGIPKRLRRTCGGHFVTAAAGTPGAFRTGCDEHAAGIS